MKIHSKNFILSFSDFYDIKVQTIRSFEILSRLSGIPVEEIIKILKLDEVSRMYTEFKRGKLACAEFSSYFTEKLNVMNLGVATPEMFRLAWRARFDEFHLSSAVPLLKIAMKMLKHDGVSISLVMLSNTWDLEVLKNKLVELEDEQLRLEEIANSESHVRSFFIGGIRLYTSCQYQTTKSDLIRIIVQDLKNKFDTLDDKEKSIPQRNNSILGKFSKFGSFDAAGQDCINPQITFLYKSANEGMVAEADRRANATPDKMLDACRDYGVRAYWWRPSVQSLESFFEETVVAEQSESVDDVELSQLNICHF